MTDSSRHGRPARTDVHAVAEHIDALSRAGTCPRCEEAMTPVASDAAQLLIEIIRLRDALLRRGWSPLTGSLPSARPWARRLTRKVTLWLTCATRSGITRQRAGGRA